MENQNQNQNQNGPTVDGDNGKGILSPDFGVVVAPQEYNSDSLSLDPALAHVSQLDGDATLPAKRKNPFTALTKKADLVLAILLILIVAGLLFTTETKKSDKTQLSTNDITSKYETQNIPLTGFVVSDQGVSLQSSKVAINGGLTVNGEIVITPSLQPESPKAGQLYYDQVSNVLAYYNGTAYVTLSGSTQGVVQSLGGLSGQIGLAGGLSIVGNQLVNAGVLSLGGTAGTIVLGNGLNMTNNILQNTGVLNLTAGTPNVTITDNGGGNVSVSVTGSGTGTVGSGGGTNGAIPVFTASQNIEDSIISQSGANITVGGGLSVTGALGLGSALTVANGGTGATSLTANGVIVGNGTSALSSVTAGGAGLCFVSTAGAPTWAACPGGGGVTSLNSLTGALSIANASAAGSTVTINDASTAAKGIAQFNGTNFSAAAGVINTTQDINSGATPTFAGLNTNIITPSGALTVGDVGQTVLLQGSTVTVTSNSGGDIELDSADQVRLIGFDCTTFTNGGTLTTDASGNLACANDDSGAGGVTSLNTLTGGLTLAGTAGQISVNDNGIDTITLALNAAVTLQGNTFNGANQLVQLNASTQLPAVSGALLTNLNASALATGTVPSGVVSGSYTGITGVGTVTVGTWQGTVVADGFVADNLTISSSGSVDWTALMSYPSGCGAGQAVTAVGDTLTCAAFAAASGSGNYINNTTTLQTSANFNIQSSVTTEVTANFQALSSQTADIIRVRNAANTVTVFSVDPDGDVVATSFTGDGSGLTALNGSNISTGTVANARLVNSGALTVTAGTGLSGGGSVALGGSATLNLADTAVTPSSYGSASQVATFTVDQQGRLTAASSTNIAIAGTQITSGTINDARLSANVTVQGNTFNGANQLIQLNASTELPTVSGVNLTALNATQLTSGTVPAARISGSYTGITGVGTITAGTWQGTAVGISYGGTGATTSQGAINAISQLTTEGDLLYHNGTNSTRLARGSDQQCLISTTTGIMWSSCSSGGGITGSGSNGQVAFFNGTGSITSDTDLLFNGTTLTANTLSVTNNAAIQGSLTLGDAGPAGTTGSLVFNNDTNSNTATIQSGTTSTSYTLTLPTAVGGANQCLKAQNGTGTLFWDDCEGGSGGTSGVTDVNSLDGSLTLQGTANRITVNDNGTDTITIDVGTNVTVQGNTFNGANQLIQLNASTELPTVSGVNLTALNATQLTSGTVPAARISGSYTGITGVGTITAGTWQGTAVADTYVADNLTISSSGTVDWTALNNYPTGCSAGQAVTAVGDTLTCAAFASATLSLQDAYDNGNTISTDASGNIAFTLNGEDFTVTSAANTNSFTSFSLADGSNATPASQLVLISNNDANEALANGLTVTSAAGTIVDGLDVSDAEIDNAINVGDNIILGGAATINFTNFDVSNAGAVSNITGLSMASGNFVQNGSGTFATGTGTVSLNGDTTLATGKNFTLQDGAGQLRLDTDGQVYILEEGSTDTDIMELFGRVGYKFYVNTGQEVLAVNQNGMTTVTARDDNNGGLSVKQSNGNPVFFVGTESTEGSVSVGYGSDSAATIFYLDGDATSEPTGGEGGMYYNNSTNKFRCYQNTGWTDCITTDTGVTTVGAFSGSSQTNGATISGNTITFGPADGTNPGMVSTGSQTFAGDKTFSGNITVQGTGGLTFNTGAGGDITFAQGEKIDNDTNGTINLSANSGAITLLLTGTAANINNSAGNITFNSAGTIELQDSTNIAGALGVTGGLTSLTGATSGDALNVSNSTSTGNIAVFSDNATAVFTLANGGGALFKNQTDSTSGFQIQSSSSSTGIFQVDTQNRRVGINVTPASSDFEVSGTTKLGDTNSLGALVVTRADDSNSLQVDTSNNRVYVGDAASSAGTDTTLLIVDSATTANAPTGVNGGLFYDTTLNKFRCYQNTGWTDCITTDTGVTAVGAFSGTSIANGASISGNTITFGPADGTNPGMVTTGSQTFGGAKTFASNVTVQGTGGLVFDTGVGGDITFANLEKIDNDTNGTINLSANSGAITLLLTGTAANINNSAGNLAIDAVGTIDLQDSTNISGNLDVSGTLAVGTADALQVSAAGDITLNNAANHSLSVAARSTNAAGRSFTLSAGDAGAGASPFDGGAVTIQGGNAAGTGSADGGAIVLQAGNRVGAGETGQVIIKAGTGDRFDFFSVRRSDDSILLGLNSQNGHLYLGTSGPGQSYDLTFENNGLGRTIGVDDTSTTDGDNLTLRAGSSTASNADGGNIILQGGDANGTGVNGFVLVQNVTDSASSFLVQNAASTETMFSIDTTARSASGGNLIKIGNSTGTDTALTILKLDGATADPTSNLAALNGGLFYNSTTNKVSIIENGAVKVLCNKTDLACGAGATTPLQTAYNDDVDGSDAIIVLSDEDDSIIIRNPNDSANDTDSAFLFKIEQLLATGTQEGLVVESNGSGNLLRVTDTTATARDVLSIANGGATTLRNQTNSADAFRILDAGGTELEGVDTASNIIRLLSNNTASNGGRLSGTGSNWNTATSLPGSGRFAGAAVALNGYLYQIGGCDSGGATDDVYYAQIKSDGSLGSWTTSGTLLPTNLCGTSATTYNGYIYVHGGTGSAAASQDIYYTKPNADGSISSWRTQDNPVGLVDHVDGSIVAYNGYLYATAGISDDGGATRRRGLYYGKINADGSVPSFSVQANWLADLDFNPGQALIANGYIYVMGTANYDKFYFDSLNETTGAPTNSAATAANSGTAVTDARKNASIAVLNGYMYAIAGGTSGLATMQYGAIASNGDLPAFSSSAASDSITLPAVRDVCSKVAPTYNNYIYMVGCSDGTFSPTTGVYYASGARVKVGGSLDLVGYSGEGMSEGGSGGQLTAGNTFINGLLSVSGNAVFRDGLAVNTGLSIDAGSTAANQTLLNIGNSSIGSIFKVEQLGANFGSLVTAGGFMALNSYFGEEFSQARVTVTGAFAQSWGDGSGTTDGAGAGFFSTGETGTGCQWVSQTSELNGVARINASTSGSSCTAHNSTTAGGTNINAMFDVDNLPVIYMKVRPSVGSTGVPDNDHQFFMGLTSAVSDTPAADRPTNFIGFTNCSDAAGNTCDTTWRVQANDATAPAACMTSQTVSETVYAVLVIKVIANNNIQFWIDSDTTDGVSLQLCNTVTSIGSTAGMSAVLKADFETGSNAANLDVDYFRAWQDDPAGVANPTEDPNYVAPLTADSGQREDQIGIIDFTNATSEDQVFDHDVYVRGTLFADKIRANQIDGLQAYDEKIAELEQQLISLASGNGGTLSPASMPINLDIQGSLTVNGSAEFQGNALFRNGLILGGHVSTDGESPTVATGAAAGITLMPSNNPNAMLASAQVQGNDVSGKMSVHAGEDATAGELVTITFKKPYARPPHIFLTPTNLEATRLKYYLQTTEQGFKLMLSEPMSVGTTATFSYWVVE